MRKSEISIIVPVYNVEKYLYQCLDSILAQTFNDFELILVDDGSLDNSGAICDEYAAKDSRIWVIHKENAGVSVARNTALECANGKYITFCDSDDYYSPDWLERLYSNMIEYQADMVIGNYQKFDDISGEFLKKTTHENGLVVLQSEQDRIKYVIDQVFGNKCGWEVWTRLFRNSIIQENGIRFCTSCDNFAEDLGFVLEYLLYTGLVYSCDNTGYHCRVRVGSMMYSSRDVVKLNCMNEVSACFEQEYMNKINDATLRRQYPIIHFLIMMAQYQKLVGTAEYNRLPVEIRKIKKHAWYKKQTRGIFRCYRSMKKRFGKDYARRICLLSHYCLHGNWKLFVMESTVYYKFLVRM